MAIQIVVIVVVIDRGDESPAFIPFVGMPIAPCFKLYCCVKQNSCVEIWGRVYKLIKGNIKVKRIREICDQGEVQLLFSFSLVAERASNRQKLRF